MMAGREKRRGWAKIFRRPDCLEAFGQVRCLRGVQGMSRDHLEKHRRMHQEDHRLIGAPAMILVPGNGARGHGRRGGIGFAVPGCLDRMLHGHVLDDRKAAVLSAFNITSDPVDFAQAIDLKLIFTF